MEVREARPDELPRALELAFQHLPATERERRWRNLAGLLAGGSCNSIGVLVLHGDAQELIGAVLCELLPGRTGLVWPPQVAAVARVDSYKDQLARKAVGWLSKHGATTLQAVLAGAETDLASPLLRTGFVHTTSLRYLRCRLHEVVDSAPVLSPLTIEPYERCDRGLFQATLLRSYEGSLDCPELNGRREPRDIIAAHQAHGRHEPDFWWLIRYAGEPAGVLIAAGIPGTTGYEIAYVGVVPQMRERGVARETMRRALAQMRVREASEVAITVDSRNQPALQLYASLGFEEFDCREVYLRL